MTLTIQHDSTTSLTSERDAVTDGFRRLQHGGLWNRLKRDGLVGIIRVPEVTWGQRTGWHLHVHTLVIARSGAVEAGRALVNRWLHLAQERGFSASKRGQDVRQVTRDGGVGDYGVKGMRSWGAALELAGQWKKTGKRPGRLGVAELLALAAEGDRVAGARYAEAVASLKGMRVMTIGPALKKALGVSFDDAADEEAIEVAKQPGEWLGALSSEVWSEVTRQRRRREIVRLIWRHRDVEWSDVERLIWRRIDPSRTDGRPAQRPAQNLQSPPPVGGKGVIVNFGERVP